VDDVIVALREKYYDGLLLILLLIITSL